MTIPVKADVRSSFCYSMLFLRNIKNEGSMTVKGIAELAEEVSNFLPEEDD